MLKCCECERDIDIENKIYRCFDGTVCSNKCQIDRFQKIISKDKKISNFSSWENTTSYLIDPNETTKEIHKTPSFVPIYVKSRSDLKKTISKYNLHYLNNINTNNNNNNNNTKNNNNVYFNNTLEQNIFLENLRRLNIFNNRYNDSSCNFLYNGVNKLYNIMNKMI